MLILSDDHEQTPSIHDHFSWDTRLTIKAFPLSNSASDSIMSSSAHITQLRKWLLKSPPGEWLITHIRKLLIGALRQGPIPRHVAFVMDGNRRYARENRLETIEGHHMGFVALAKVGICTAIGLYSAADRNV